MITLSPSPLDAPAFAARVAAVINGAVASGGWSSVYVIMLDNWFGDKWLHFSHKIGGSPGFHNYGPMVPVPPFKPSRVKSQIRWVIDDASGEFVPVSSAPVNVDQFGGDNGYRRVGELFPDSALFWYSGGSLRNGRGSLMAYVPGYDRYTCWYAESTPARSWRETRTIGITSGELEFFADYVRPAN